MIPNDFGLFMLIHGDIDLAVKEHQDQHLKIENGDFWEKENYFSFNNFLPMQ